MLNQIQIDLNSTQKINFNKSFNLPQIIAINYFCWQRDIISFIADMKQQEQQIQYDVFYRGTKEELIAFLYPLTGPTHPLFDHFQPKNMLYDLNRKTVEVKYEPKDFQNIDKQKEQITYKSTLVPTQSNYFYSIFQPEYNCFVWQSINHFLQMRPMTKGMEQSKGVQSLQEVGKVELEVIEYENSENKVRELIDDTIITPVKENWQASKEEYLIHLAK